MGFIEAVESQIYGGGWVNIPLLALASLLFYILGYRFFLLFDSMERRSKNKRNDSIIGRAEARLKFAGERLTDTLSQEILLNVKREASQFASLSNTLVALAPLLGLLGTVIGMIETFSSLGDQSLFSSSGGIAGGISQALITTQVGLIIAVPGLFASRFLKKIEKEILQTTEQLIETYKLHQLRSVP